ncbi:hypothetical protein HDV03_004700 [Kappamyces sp. JEL0829]|nr:hypothetical protein HDV03_004700 [Kappamyces sp. JEL0829]
MLVLWASFLVALLAVWWSALVPSVNGPLGSLQDVVWTKELQTLYKSELVPFRADTWPEHGWVDLPFGLTHYYVFGPEDGQKLVFVHGMTSPAPTLKAFLDCLAAKGYRILAYDLYGRGYSASPGVVFDDGLLISQLATLLHKLAWGKTYIVGYSLGGAITTGYVTRYPEDIEKVALIAPAGLMKTISPLAHLLKVPVVGPLFIHTLGARIISRLSTTNHLFDETENPDIKHFNDLQRFHIMHNPGLLRAFASTVLNFPWGGFAERYRRLGMTHQVNVLWGDKDTVVPTELSKDLAELIPDLNLVIQPGYGHSIPIENARLTADIVHSFFRDQ